MTKSITEYFFHNISCFGDDKVRFKKKLTRNIAIFRFLGNDKEWPKKRSDFRASLFPKISKFQFFQKCRNQKIMEGQFSWHPSIIFFFMQRIPTAFVILPTVFLLFQTINTCTSFRRSHISIRRIHLPSQTSTLFRQLTWQTRHDSPWDSLRSSRF